MADLKTRMHFINVLLEEWIKTDHLNDQQLGSEVRKWYWQNEHRTEYWMIDEGYVPWWDGDGVNQAKKFTGEDALDYMYGGGDDVVDNSSDE